MWQPCRYHISFFPNDPKCRLGMCQNLWRFLTSCESIERCKCVVVPGTGDMVPGTGTLVPRTGTLVPGTSPWDQLEGGTSQFGRALDDFHIDAKTAQIVVEHVRERQRSKPDEKCDDLVQILTGNVKGLERRLEAEMREKDNLRRQLQQFKDTMHNCRYF